MLRFGKAQLASLAATGVDFGVTAGAGRLMPWFMAATVLGTVCGGMVHFSLGRTWVFVAREGVPRTQALRYGVGWTGNLVLNAVGVYAIIHWTGLPPLAGKAAVSVLLATTYNYFVQAHFVFRRF